MQSAFFTPQPSYSNPRKRKLDSFQSDPLLEAQIKVTGLGKGELAQPEKILEIFQRFGAIVNTHAPQINLPFKCEQKIYKGDFFITYPTLASAKQAVFELNHKLVGNYRIKVELFKEPNLNAVSLKRRKLREEDFYSKIYVSPLPFSLLQNTDEVKKLWQKFGQIESVNVPNPQGGYCFINYVSPEGAQKALQMNGSNYHGRKLIVSYADHQTVNDRTFTGSTRWIFVKGVPQNMGIEEIQKMFSEFGEIEDLDQSNWQRRNIFLQYKHIDSVRMCLANVSKSVVVQERKSETQQQPILSDHTSYSNNSYRGPQPPSYNPLQRPVLQTNGGAWE